MAVGCARDEWLRLEDGALLAQCAIETRRVGGPGGQKRNKTSSAIRLTHRPSGVSVIAGESRSQAENKARAVRRLRRAIALFCRRPIDKDWQPPIRWAKHFSAGSSSLSQRHADYVSVVAVVLDALTARHGRVSEAAALLGLSTAALSRFITRDGKLLAEVNRLRSLEGVRPLVP